MTKYILGGGIAGLIAKYYNPSYKLITPDIGGQLKDNNAAISFFIHNTKETRELLDKLGVAYEEEVINIFYFINGKLCKNIDNSQRQRLVAHKMTEYYCDYSDFIIKDTNLSVQENKLLVLTTDVNKLIDELKPDNEDMINARIKLINIQNNSLLIKEGDDLKTLKYDKLISTIPANIFFYMLYNYKHNYNFNYIPATYIISTQRPDFCKENGIYYVDDEYLIYNRVTVFDSYCIYDITGTPTEDELNLKFKDITKISRQYTAIVKSINIYNFRNIKFIGRNAQWNHKVHIEENIKLARRIKENENTQR